MHASRPQPQSVIFYENAAHPSRFPHAAMTAVALPPAAADMAPAFFKEAILTSDEEWTQHVKIIDTAARAREAGMGRAAFRKSLAKEMPYFHVSMNKRQKEQIKQGIKDLAVLLFTTVFSTLKFPLSNIYFLFFFFLALGMVQSRRRHGPRHRRREPLAPWRSLCPRDPRRHARRRTGNHQTAGQMASPASPERPERPERPATAG